MPEFSRIKSFLQLRWVRVIAITAVCILAFAAISAAGQCLFYLSGNDMTLLTELTIWTWLLLLGIFVVRDWSRIFLVIVALIVLVLAPGCILTVRPTVLVAERLQVAAQAVHASVVSSHAVYPTQMPSTVTSIGSLGAERRYEFHYVAFGDAASGANSHFRIEAVRRHCLCRVLTNMTIFDDGTIYSTHENRAATSSDEIDYKPSKDAQLP